jgi:hypothetical protein
VERWNFGTLEPWNFGTLYKEMTRPSRAER